MPLDLRAILIVRLRARAIAALPTGMQRQAAHHPIALLERLHFRADSGDGARAFVRGCLRERAAEDAVQDHAVCVAV